ncbi:MAG: exo-alpha-sialidase [Firmicutes bacterium]|nr:exo-alpha-sialidase [Bacillota bacterium]
MKVNRSMSVGFLFMVFFLLVFIAACDSSRAMTGEDYTIPQLDLSQRPDDLHPRYDYLFENVIVDNSGDYLGHPDSVLLENGDILTMYPEGHGKGPVRTRISTDGGKTWKDGPGKTPGSWVGSRETPTVYRLEFSDERATDRLIMISGNPKWPRESTEGGFNCSISENEGQSWSEFELFYDHSSSRKVVPIVAMASLTRLKEDGEFVDKWMGLFHDRNFINYRTVLSFDENGRMQWSEPCPYFGEFRNIEKQAAMCEVEVIRSDGGQGDELCLIARSNGKHGRKNNNSLVSFSQDEGETWSVPQEVPAALNGERHKAVYTKDGRLFITFRSIERAPEKLERYAEGKKKSNWYSEGWVAWVGTYEDLKEGTEGQYRIKIAHTYLDGQEVPAMAANADTGYCGNVVLDDGMIVTCSYGRFDPQDVFIDSKGKPVVRTSIVSKCINLADTDVLVTMMGE